MGYRLEINTIERNEKYERIVKNRFYGTKYYGYEDLDESLSYMFLKLINKFDGDECFCYGSDNTIILNYKEFEMFCSLYDIDLQKVR